MNEEQLILAVNPGSTTTKIGVYRAPPPPHSEVEEVLAKSIHHSAEELSVFEHPADQFDFRKNAVLETLKEGGIDLSRIVLIMGRGGLIKPVRSGIIRVSEAMLHDLRIGYGGEHASNLGGIIAHELTKIIPRAQAYIVDPVVVDEREEVAKVSGHPLVKRPPVWHALNHKATARIHAEKIGRRYEDLNLIVAHMGGGVSVGAHREGRVVDVNTAFDGDGPLTPERSGSLPTGPLVELCFSGKYTREEVMKMLSGEGGYAAYLGTKNAAEVEEKAAAGKTPHELIRGAMVHQIAKEIGAAAAVLEGKIDAILLTGGIAYSETFTTDLSRKIAFLAPVYIYPGENEVFSLAYNGGRILRGEAVIMEYE